LVFALAFTIFILGSSNYAIAQQDLSPLLTSDLDWHPDGNSVAVGYARWGERQHLVSCGEDTGIPLIDVTSNQTTFFQRDYDACTPSTIDFNATGTQIVVTSGSTLEAWDLVTGQKVGGIFMETVFQSAAFSPNSMNVVVTRIADVSIRDATLIAGNKVFIRPQTTPNTSFIYSAWSADGQKVATAAADGWIYIWSTVNAQLLTTFQGHTAAVKRLAWNPVTNVIASGDDNGAIWLWDAATGQSIRQLTGHTGIVYDVTWHPDGQTLVSAGGDNTLRSWNAATGAMTIIDSGRLFSAVAYSPHGSQLAYGGEIADLANLNVEIVEISATLTATSTNTATLTSTSTQTPTRTPTLTPTATPTPAIGTIQLSGVPATVQLNETTRAWLTYTFTLSQRPVPTTGSSHAAFRLSVTDPTGIMGRCDFRRNPRTGFILQAFDPLSDVSFEP